ncbi:amino acid ABC transporter ATP-binding/permease protein [Acidovorax sp. MR-S7]|uniref:amino acid ABC transporter ATP-binding/permease protein n=1 Tax=Acidovorax sp. MR-S7 TaxID=1268622 RepID=UPI0003678739|nr:ATP-binding cassette domain-containing protein [Acidovorax sp. MR-S7]GAD24491.1 ABC-type transport system involved in cytochrome bd biosynthesis, fused ATPase and permease components [Acidovorax sp. MR-S7]
MRVIRLLLGTFRQRLWWGAALAAFTVLAGMGLLSLSSWFIAATAIAGLQAGSALVFDVFMPSAGIRMLALGRTASRYSERLVTHDATLAALAELRARVFRGLAASRQRVRQPARALSRLTSELDALESLYLRLLVPACAALGAALLTAFILGMMAPWFGLLIGLWLLLAGLGLAWALARAARAPALRRAMAIERLRAHAIDLVSGQTELLMSQRLGAQCQALARADQRLASADRQLNRLDARAGAAYGVAGSVTLALALLGVGGLADQGQIGTAGAALVLLLAMAAMEPFAALRRGALEAGRVWLAARRLGGPLASGPSGPAAGPAVSAPEGALHLNRVSTRYPGSRVDALQGVSLALGPTERVALIGPSGSGKSTLMALATGAIPALRGSIQAQPHAWMGQRIDLFQDSLRDNLRLAAPRADDTVLWAALDAAGLAADVRAMSGGLDTHLGEGGLGLSGGQARRLALARLLLKPHRLWLLDEPTESLDAATAADVLKKLDELGAGRAWLVATHLRREAALADRLLVMRDGRIEAEWWRGSAGFDAALAGLRSD